VALTEDGTPLGSDEILINADRAEAKVTLSRVEALDESTTQVEAEVRVPLGAKLDRVEMFWNDTLGVTLNEPPFAASLKTPATGTGADFVRVVAHFDDGTWVEGVRLLGAGSLGEEISVNLIELYAVLTDKEGQPVTELSAADLAVRGNGKTYPIERFAPAEDLTLSLGLIIDTSESMWTLMPDTKRAASMFLGRILSERDRAFVVDFDNQPRLSLSSTGDIVSLVTAISSLEASGATAMFDAIAFASLQFDEEIGRRALVLLTDGDDYKSKLGLNKAVQQARQSGAPIYVIGLGGLDGFRRDLKTIDVEAIAHGTGGRVFLVQSMDQLSEAYRQIETDLRSQYLIAISTEEQLSPEQLGDLEIKSSRRDLDVRVVVSPLSH
jgi:VWFA-related protein